MPSLFSFVFIGCILVVLNVYQFASAFLQDLTGIEDVTICRDVLTRHNWDLEGAVSDQLNIRDGHPSVYASSETHAPAVVNELMFQHVFFSPPSDGSWFSISRLFQYGYSILQTISVMVYKFLLGDNRRCTFCSFIIFSYPCV